MIKRDSLWEYYREHSESRRRKARGFIDWRDYLDYLERTYGRLMNGKLRRMISDWDPSVWRTQ